MLQKRYSTLTMLWAMIAATFGVIALAVLASSASAQVQSEPIVVPGLVQAESWTDAVDTDDANFGNGGVRVDEAVDIWATPGAPGGFTVGRTRGGERLEWTVSVETPASLMFAPRVATGWASPGAVTVSVDGTVVVDAVVPEARGWWAFDTLAAEPIALATGTHRVEMVFGGDGQVNVDRLDVIEADGIACWSEAGRVTWAGRGADVVWVYRTTDEAGPSWIGRWKASDPGANPPVFTDRYPIIGSQYEIRQPGRPPQDCETVSEPETSLGLVCIDDGSGGLSWTDLSATKYWIYRSEDAGATWSWIGRTVDPIDPTAPAPTTFSDPTPADDARYLVHFANFPRTECRAAPSPVPPSPPPPPPAIAEGTIFVDAGATPGGDGSAGSPFANLEEGLEALPDSGTLIVGDGEYVENISVGWSGEIAQGTAEDPVRVRAADGARPVVKGILRLHNMVHWDVSGINVTWNDVNASNNHMVVLNGGRNWTFRDAEVWGAKSFAGVVVGDSPGTGEPVDWTLSGLYVHDTVPSNDTNQDHLLYINGGAGGGVIEGNLLVGSPNGRAIKIGTVGADDPAIGNVTVRYNTMVDNTGPSNLQLSYRTSDVTIERNLMVSPKPGQSNITTYRLEGANNLARDNLGWDSVGVVDDDVGLIDGGSNVSDIDPDLDADYLPQNPAAQAYGHGALSG